MLGRVASVLMDSPQHLGFLIPWNNEVSIYAVMSALLGPMIIPLTNFVIFARVA